MFNDNVDSSHLAIGSPEMMRFSNDGALRCQLYVIPVSAPQSRVGKASAWYTSHLLFVLRAHADQNNVNL